MYKTKGSIAGGTSNKVAFYNGTIDGTTDEVAIYCWWYNLWGSYLLLMVQLMK